MNRSSYRWLCLLALVMAFAFQASAQDATIVGTITDPQGAVVPGATITFTNTVTGQSSTTVSNEAGQYLEGSLRIGTYTVKAEAKGFKTWTTSDVALKVGDRTRVDVRLEIGASTESITVEAGLVRVQSEPGRPRRGGEGQNPSVRGEDSLSLEARVGALKMENPAPGSRATRGSGSHVG